MSSVKHILGISGGKDSAALAIYLNGLYPEMNVEYYTSDTGRELDETYQLIERLESHMGKTIKKLDSVDLTNISDKNAFDHFLSLYGGYLPSSTSRWCTKKLKLEPFENYVGDEPTISYVGIRGDEDRDGYISKKQTVQSIFPFRKNIWSEDVNRLVLANSTINQIKGLYESVCSSDKLEAILKYVTEPISGTFNLKKKLNALIDLDVVSYNKVVFEFLKGTDYPVGKLEHFPLVNNRDNLVIEDIFKILEDSGVGVPAYYTPMEYQVEINGEIKKGTYSRSRSGCFFCFYQQKIEWVWLYETHNDLFMAAIEYEKEGYSWMDSETLEDLAEPDRIKAIKKEHYLRMNKRNKPLNWKDQIVEAELEGCASCFI